MAYTGTTITVNCGRGGFCGAKNIDEVANYMMMPPTRNLIYERGGRRKRGGTAKMYENAYDAAVTSLFRVRFSTNLSYLLAGDGNGDIYAGEATKITTAPLGGPMSFEYGEDKVFIADGVNVPHVWTGTGNVAAIAGPTADFSTDPVFQVKLHKVGQSERMCAINRRGLYMSKSSILSGDMEDFSTDPIFFPITTEDGYGPVAMDEIGDQLVIFGRKKAYRLNDQSASPDEWYIYPAQWSGGVANWRLLVETPNDWLAMSDDGDIYSVSAVESYGDYKLASLTRASWMWDWIREHVDLAQTSLFHGCYDPALRAVRYFVALVGQTLPTTCLLYYIEREPAEAWMIEDNQKATSGYDAASSHVALDPATGTYEMLTGGHDGHIWRLNQANRSDDGGGYYGGFRTPPDAFGDFRTAKHYNQCHLTTQSVASHMLQVRMWIDGVALGKAYGVELSGGGVALGSFKLDVDKLGSRTPLEASFKIGRRGRRLQYEFYTDGADEDFFITQFSTDVKSRGAETQNNEGVT
jgi:hypothetical protein